MHGYDVKQTEMHGLAQRFGALQCHVRFGEKVYSPFVITADLIIALDLLEAARALNFASKNTIILSESSAMAPDPMAQINTKIFVRELKKKAKIFIVDAAKITGKLIGETTMSNIFMLGYALKKKFLPLKKELVWKAITQKLRPEFLEKNKKVFEAAFKNKTKNSNFIL